jgi:hypothetical protein
MYICLMSEASNCTLELFNATNCFFYGEQCSLSTQSAPQAG